MTAASVVVTAGASSSAAALVAGTVDEPLTRDEPLGVEGAFGDLGAEGAFGDLGAVGAFGDLGAEGAFGDFGAVGAFGDLGAVGAFGDLGAEGAFGDLGAVDALGDLGAAIIMASVPTRNPTSCPSLFPSPFVSHFNGSSPSRNSRSSLRPSPSVSLVRVFACKVFFTVWRVDIDRARNAELRPTRTHKATTATPFKHPFPLDRRRSS